MQERGLISHLTPPPLTRPPPRPPHQPTRAAHDSTVKTASGVSSGIGGDSENEGRLEEGRPTVRPATRIRGKSDGGISHGSIDPSTSSASTSVATSAGTNSTSNSTAIHNNDGDSRLAGAHGLERESAAGSRGRGGDGDAMEEWNFERLGRTPLLAAAFEDFCRRALCHESVLFLSEVSR